MHMTFQVSKWHFPLVLNGALGPTLLGEFMTFKWCVWRTHWVLWNSLDLRHAKVPEKQNYLAFVLPMQSMKFPSHSPHDSLAWSYHGAITTQKCKVNTFHAKKQFCLYTVCITWVCLQNEQAIKTRLSVPSRAARVLNERASRMHSITVWLWPFQGSSWFDSNVVWRIIYISVVRTWVC